VGSVQPIRPGAVNWMTAGRGIAHSERTPPALREADSRLYGIQSWVALPIEHEDDAPSFLHIDQAALPMVEGEGKIVRLIAGALYGARSPVPTLWPSFYADVSLAAASCLELPTEHEERAAYLLEGAVAIGDETFEPGQLLVFAPGAAPTIGAATPARLLLLGGAPMDGPRHIWWNFVASSRDRIEQAKADWTAGRFAAVPGENEPIPLPE
jgi:redox-sensitive bicupin YhaK (pirin superfamily)